MSWYPLGRPVGSTTYPGLQFTACAIHWVLRQFGKAYRMTINDICCYMPCWGGAAATLFIALFTYEVTKSRTAGVISAAIFCIIPGHLMRSMGGGFDNECIAMAAMLMTFYFWVRSLRNERSWWIGIIAGLAYGYMVAAWGGYVFVLNMVALHAGFSMALDMVRNRYDPILYKSYTLFFIVGTFIATCVPPVGMAPFKSLEQMLALLVFIFGHTIHLSEFARRKEEVEIMSRKGVMIRLRYVFATVSILLVAAFVIVPSGFFGPLSSRVRGLFVTHTRTGNPLVDSVAEHQPATSDAYWHYLHLCCYFWNISVFILPFLKKRPRAAQFMTLYGGVAYYFSLKMARLIILSGPVASAGTGLCVGFLLEWALGQFFWSEADEIEEQLAAQGKDKNGKLLLKKGAKTESLETTVTEFRLKFKSQRRMRLAMAVVFVAFLASGKARNEFVEHSEHMAESFANPQLMFKSRLNDGRVVIIDDYREAYHWLRDTTPEDSRVMAWWDYGYQITGIGNRTSIADGNTWNHEHIATVGKCLTSPVKEAHSLIRHLADYVLVWAGGGGDDLAKSPHMARIGNSVYRDICPEDDPLCSHFGFMGSYDNPTPSMKRSLLYSLSQVSTNPKVTLDEKLFKMIYHSQYGLIRIFKVMNVSQESKDWVADPANRICDPPGSWMCKGQYPPAPVIQKLLKKRIDFGQLEDFNRKQKDEKYHKNYMKKMTKDRE
eukprot:GILI01011279.1.p1 GENE.GILI01011279.1~~GILI01011279.1.p1  ORF type:complete len:820 (+),score=206.24 GILI01011279.1:310-2460(+)